MIRAAYLQAADAAVDLLGDPAVAAGWERASALAEFSVKGLAGHLARQIILVPQILAGDVPQAPRVSLLDHYAPASWIDVDLNDEVQVGVRRGGEALAADGPAALVAQARGMVASLRDRLPGEPAERVVYLPWARWSLSLDDFLVTRMMEIAVHSDDLAVSVDIPTPALPQAVLDPVFSLLTGLAVRRHGATAVLRALSRAERAPAGIAAI